jgi:uncharacterized protein (TIGR02757 family)
MTRVHAALDAVRAGCDMAARRDADPVGIVHRYPDPADRELVALAASCVAFGNAKVIRAKLDDLLTRVGPHPAQAAENPVALRARLQGWRARVFQGDDLARLLVGGRVLQRKHGSLGALFEAELRRATGKEKGVGVGKRVGVGRGKRVAVGNDQPDSKGTDADALREALGAWCDALRAAGGLRRDGARRGPAHLLPDPRGPSGCKRLLLFLRWMVRPADGVDLGMWNVAPARLLVPVDVHIHRLARNLGLTRRGGTSWKTTEEITGALAQFDPADPVSYDFALCHMGMLQRCPSRRDPALCEGCGIQAVCVHWAKAGKLAGVASAALKARAGATTRPAKPASAPAPGRATGRRFPRGLGATK